VGCRFHQIVTFRSDSKLRIIEILNREFGRVISSHRNPSGNRGRDRREGQNMESGNLNHRWNEIVTEGPFASGGSLNFKSQRPRCLRIFSISSSPSIKTKIHIWPWHCFFWRGILGVPRPRRLEESRKTLAKDFSNLTVDKLFVLFFYNQYEFRPFDWLLNFLYLDTTF
jgi:hypothetical protein